MTLTSLMLKIDFPGRTLVLVAPASGRMLKLPDGAGFISCCALPRSAAGGRGGASVVRRGADNRLAAHRWTRAADCIAGAARVQYADPVAGKLSAHAGDSLGQVTYSFVG